MSHHTGLSEMRLDYYLEQSGISKAGLARVAGVSRQLVNNWLCREGMYVLCTEDYEIKRIERRVTKILWHQN